MKEFQKALCMFTGFILGYGFGDVIKGKEFNSGLLALAFFFILINVTILIAKSNK